ncbi:MAG: hypothetical protein PHC62_06960 [Candidatus Izemoplasmatales bacterium]|nr:hypothetical protein [Candidatus Izemoplasmatales bacterium]
MKNLQKSIVIVFLSSFIFLTSICVFGWYTVYRVIDITITDVSEPYILELLYPIDSAPILTEEEISAKLSDTYNISAFVDSMNGYIDEDGFGSSKLYSDVQCLFTASGDNGYIFSYTSLPPTTYKIALIFEDGTITSTSIITQSLIRAEISFDGVTLGFEEFDHIQIVLLESPVSWNYYFTKVIFQIMFIIVLIAIEMLILFHFGFKGKIFYIKMGLLYTVFYSISNVLQLIREKTMLDDVSLYLPYLNILIIGSIIVFETRVLAKKYRHQTSLKTFIYVVLANAFLIAFSIWIYQTGFFLNIILS